ncbi:murein hydrolase activator EnvC family protein [Marinactinospora thermotolerans]|uniref:murein hydrolase activator EnvC family protein n=1 Tax=Marinactinospora thermotolerans TaxID=531310 RepID=UPI003D8BDDBC
MNPTRRPPARLFPSIALFLASLLAWTAVPAVPPAVADTGPWAWPVDAPHVVLRPFVAPPSPWSAGHRGVDLLTDDGAVVRSAGAGRVAFAGRVAGTGVVSVAHGSLRTTYLPVTPLVESGTPVAPGDPIGTLSASPPHCGAHPCLHWGLLDGDAYLDPLALVGRGRHRLLPSVPAPARALTPADAPCCRHG